MIDYSAHRQVLTAERDLDRALATLRDTDPDDATAHDQALYLVFRATRIVRHARTRNPGMRRVQVTM